MTTTECKPVKDLPNGLINELLNASLQKLLKSKKSFAEWTMLVCDWGLALGQLAVMFGSDRLAL